MIYITVKQSPAYHQMSLEEFLFQEYTASPIINPNTANTRTYVVDHVSERFRRDFDVQNLMDKLNQFNESTQELREKDRASLYDRFYIPKKTGGLREINAPKPELMDALRRLKIIFEEDFHALYHTSAFAYVKQRCTVDAVKRHQQNESKWFAKLDLHDFFGSTNLNFVMDMFSKVFPFSEVICMQSGRAALRTALELAFLHGGLPQGTPISPLITNIMMIPVDFALTKEFQDHNKQKFVYTRYADDFLISSKYSFDVRDIERMVKNTLRGFRAPFTINESKTRYGSSAGSNWNLGVMLNKDNEITVGHKAKKRLQSMLYNYVRDKRNNTPWDRNDIQVMNGLISYYKMVEEANINAILKHVNGKLNTNVMNLIREDLR